MQAGDPFYGGQRVLGGPQFDPVPEIFHQDLGFVSDLGGFLVK